jgi:hypothetical protein
MPGEPPSRHPGASAGANFCDDVETTVRFDARRGVATIAAPRALAENATVVGAVPLGGYHYYQVCVALHPTHQHRVEFALDVLPPDAASGRRANADLYIATDSAAPTVERATWISADPGSDRIAVGTHLDEFRAAPKTQSGRGVVLHVGVFGRDATRWGLPDPNTTAVPYALTVAIRNADDRDLRRRSGLRGRSGPPRAARESTRHI